MYQACSGFMFLLFRTFAVSLETGVSTETENRIQSLSLTLENSRRVSAAPQHSSNKLGSAFGLLENCRQKSEI